MNFLKRSNPVQAVAFLTSGLLFFTMAPAFAQDYPPMQGHPDQQNYPPPPTFASGQLDSVVSRIALYPDPLLAQVFAAATFPDQIQEAARFADEHQNLRGNDLANEMAAANLPFDPAVQALIPFPQVLDMMASDMNWTSQLGNAVLADRAAVMDAVQRERAAAERNGYLQDTQQMRVAGGPGAIDIEPADPGVIYVPVYDPYLVYGPPRPGFYAGNAIRFTPGFAIGFGFSNWGWGGGFNWVGHSVIVHNAVWGRTWYNRGSYVHNWGNWDGGQWRNAAVNRNVTVNNSYNVNRTVSRNDYNVNRTVTRNDNVNRYSNNYVQNNTVRNNNVQLNERNSFRGNPAATVTPNAGYQRQAAPERSTFRGNDNVRSEQHNNAPAVRESRGGGEREHGGERGRR